MKRGYLALAAGLVVTAVLALWLWTRTTDPAPSPSQTAPRIPEADPGKSRTTVTRAPASERPRLTAPDDGSDVKEYMVGDVVVRDHRLGDAPRMDVPPAIHAPLGRRIESSLTSDIVQKLRAATAECGTSVPADARGAKPRVEGTIVIAIREHQATVTGATFQVRDVTGAFEPVKSCFEQKSVGVVTPSGDEADLEGYAISMSLRLP